MGRCLALAGPVVALLAVSGCGGSGHYANDPRPPTVKQISASIVRGKVSVSPTSFGAGPISMTIANLTDASQRVSIAKRVNGQQEAGPETSPINPHDTATLSADVDPGSYVVRVEAGGIAPATITVGKRRASSSNDLLQP
jgi:hypothetical protein